MIPAAAIVDWGTTSFRLWLIDAEGAVLAERRSGEGMVVARESGFETVLEKHLADTGAQASLPVLICGMAGARQGWAEAPYVALPTTLDAIAEAAITVPHPTRHVRILPGLAQRDAAAPDVLRGEETQLAGAALGGGARLVCMPGTHCKWVAVEDGVITRFRTYLTGELFALLSGQSILRHSVGEKPAAPAADNPAFVAACRAALERGGDISGALFAIRAATLLDDLAPADAAARLSGLLIGGEVASARHMAHPGGTVVLIASGALGELYRAALELGGFEVETVDADKAVRAGLIAQARLLGIMEAR